MAPGSREVCEILLTQQDDSGMSVQRAAGRFVLQGGKLTYELERADSAPLFQQLLLEPAVVNDLEVTAAAQPALWFHNLPRTFTGSYLRAKVVT